MCAFFLSPVCRIHSFRTRFHCNLFSSSLITLKVINIFNFVLTKIMNTKNESIFFGGRKLHNTHHIQWCSERRESVSTLSPTVFLYTPLSCALSNHPQSSTLPVLLSEAMMKTMTTKMTAANLTASMTMTVTLTICLFGIFLLFSITDDDDDDVEYIRRVFSSVIVVVIIVEPIII